MSTSSGITTEKNNKTSNQNVKDKTELSELIAMALSRDPKALNKLYEKCFETIKAFFLPKICKTDWKGIPIPDGIEELCIETFEKAVQSLADSQVDIHNSSFDLFKYFENAAKKHWDDLVQKANQGNKEVIDRFYMLCRKQLKEFFKWKLRPYTHDDEDFLQTSYIIAMEKILEKPYNPTYSVYSYFKYVMDTKFFDLRMQNGGIKLPGGVTIKHSFEISASEIISDEQNREDTLPYQSSDYPNPEDILIAKEQIIQRVNTELTLLQYCAKQTKPHKFLAYGFNDVLNWKTRDIAEKCSDIPFEDLSIELFETIYYAMKWFMNKEDLFKYFSPLFEKLDKETSLIYPEEKIYLAKLKDYLNKKTKFLFLNLFYTGSPTSNISDWSYRVKEICKIDFGLD